MGVVLKTNGTICQGLKVSCIGRTNDVPNLEDGRFFIGTTGNTVTSPYGLPQSDPSDGETMVYNSSTDAFEAGYVTSSGQVSTFNLVSTHAQPLPAGVVTVIDFGATSVQTVTQTMTAGWSMGGTTLMQRTNSTRLQQPRARPIRSRWNAKFLPKRAKQVFCQRRAEAGTSHRSQEVWRLLELAATKASRSPIPTTL